MNDGLNKWLTGGMSTLVGSLTIVATANGTITRLFRNDGWWVLAAITLVLIGVLLGYLVLIPGVTAAKQSWYLRLGIIAVVVGTGIGLWVETVSLSLNDRPAIDATTQFSDGVEQLRADVTTSDIKAHDQMAVIVYGLRPDGSRGPTLYYSKSGPGADGTMDQKVQVFVDKALYQGVYVSALLIPEHVAAVNVDCDGNIIGPDGTLETMQVGSTTQPVEFRPNGKTALVGCLTLRFPQGN